VIGADFVELNPERDVDDRTADLCVRLLTALLG
jgi:arginase family enzyme